MFSRLFELGALSEVRKRRDALAKDLAWQDACRHLGEVFGTTGPDGLIQHRFGPYIVPACPGKLVTLNKKYFSMLEDIITPYQKT